LTDRNEKWLEEILADVGLWYLTQDTPEFVKIVADWGIACYIKVYLEENGYMAEIRTAGNWNEIVIQRFQ